MNQEDKTNLIHQQAFKEFLKTLREKPQHDNAHQILQYLEKNPPSEEWKQIFAICNNCKIKPPDNGLYQELEDVFKIFENRKIDLPSQDFVSIIISDLSTFWPAITVSNRIVYFKKLVDAFYKHLSIEDTKTLMNCFAVLMRNQKCLDICVENRSNMEKFINALNPLIKLQLTPYYIASILRQLKKKRFIY